MIRNTNDLDGLFERMDAWEARKGASTSPNDGFEAFDVGPDIQRIMSEIGERVNAAARRYDSLPSLGALQVDLNVIVRDVHLRFPEYVVTQSIVKAKEDIREGVAPFDVDLIIKPRYRA